MSKWFYIAIFSLSFIIGLFLPAQAEWTLPASIAEFDHNVSTPHAIAVGESLHVVAGISYDPYIYYIRSSDNGLTWTETIAPVIPYGGTGRENLLYANGLLHLVWVGEGQYDPETHFFHATSSDGGSTWSDIQEPPFPYGLVTDPRLAADGDILIFIGRGWNMLFWARSPDNGHTWDWGGYLEYGSENVGFDYPPCINIFFSGGRLHLIYQMKDFNNHPYHEIYYRYSNNYGDTWSDRILLSTIESVPEEWGSFEPSAYADSSGNIFTIWYDNKNGSECYHAGEIYGIKSDDNGHNWSNEFRLSYTGGFAGSPACLVLGEFYHALWTDKLQFGCISPKISYTESSDGGESWTEPEIISGAGQS